MTMAESPFGRRPQARLLHRGVYSEPREEVAPGVLSAIGDLGLGPPSDRLDLARWLTHPDHPLTARVQVDRLWRLAFSKGLLPSPEDLGSQGPLPPHRELLDTLARDLIEGGWDSRALLRRFVLSATYRQASGASPRARELDADNRLLSRAHAGRLPAEMVRDGLLHAAGLLVQERGGPPVHPYQPAGLWLEKSGRSYPTGRGDDLRRRSLYTFWKRTSPPPTLALFDAPSREVCTVARPATTSPLQTLALWNDPQFVEAAVVLGRRAVAAEATVEGRVGYLMRSLAGREPSAAEGRALTRLWQEQRAAYAEDPGAALALASFELEAVAHPEGELDAEGGGAPPSGALDADPNDVAERATAAVVASTLMGLDAVVSRR